MLVDYNMLPEYAGEILYADLNMLLEYHMLFNYAGRNQYATKICWQNTICYLDMLAE